jgi:hypothetical protein
MTDFSTEAIASAILEKQAMDSHWSGWSFDQIDDLNAQQDLRPRKTHLSLCEAAAYVGVSPTVFRQAVQARQMPRPLGGSEFEPCWSLSAIDWTLTSMSENALLAFRRGKR